MSKISSSPLFNLIHCMSKGEKRHFKLYSRYHTKNINEMNYLRLFDIIAKQKEYNEEKICEHGIVKKKHLPVLKHHLYHLILESLRLLRSNGDNIDNKIKNILENACIMRDKGLAEEEIKFLEKAKQLALRHERWGMALEALLREMDTASRSRDVKARQEIEGAIDLLLIKLGNLLEYMRIATKTFVHVNKSEMQRSSENKTLEKLFNHPLLRDEREGLSEIGRAHV